MNPILAFIKGWDEFKLTTTTHYNEFLIWFYDWGRELHHRATKREFDETHPDSTGNKK